MEKKKVIFFWSGGKDSALALYRIRSNPEFEVVCLITILNKKTNTVNFHGIKDSLLIQQAELLKLPLQRVYLKDGATNEEYKQTLTPFLQMYKKRGIKTAAFGDINLQDIREFKDDFFTSLEMDTLYPLWNEKTKDLALELMTLKFRATICAVLTEKLSMNFIGKDFNEDFLASLPEGVDPMGENGEFHTFVNFGPGFRSRVQFSKAMPLEVPPYYIAYLKDN